MGNKEDAVDIEEEVDFSEDEASSTASTEKDVASEASESETPKKAQATEEVSQSQMDATRLYLNEIGASELLTAEEEVYFARKAQKGDEPSRQ
jgi:RNA polymerase nonessential primary-like sigma factor